VPRCGVTAGQDDTLISYAHEWCDFDRSGPPQWLPSAGALISQFGGVITPATKHVITVAASRVYCPDKIVYQVQSHAAELRHKAPKWLRGNEIWCFRPKR
jgi:hypothetical protein